MKLNVQWCIWAKIFEAWLALIRGLILSYMIYTGMCRLEGCGFPEPFWSEISVFYAHYGLKVSVKENEVPTEKNSSRASIFATKASYISN